MSIVRDRVDAERLPESYLQEVGYRNLVIEFNENVPKPLRIIDIGFAAL
jgi:hypothetical protein